MVKMNVIMPVVFKRVSSEGLIAAVEETEMNRCGEMFPGHNKCGHPCAKEKVIEPELAEDVSIFWRDA